MLVRFTRLFLRLLSRGPEWGSRMLVHGSCHVVRSGEVACLYTALVFRVALLRELQSERARRREPLYCVCVCKLPSNR